tara:strand:+ start:3194 stop:3700 length:507 start_codon:yes stop_codon:yes gene_type:complete
MNCQNRKLNKYAVWLNILSNAVALIFITALIMSLVWSLSTRNKLPVEIKGYRIDTDNIVFRGREAQAVVILKRDLTRECKTRVTLAVQNKAGAWPSGILYELNASPEAIRQAHKKTPGEFYMTFQIPKSAPLGESTVIADATFACTDNPLHSLWPATLSVTMTIMVQE